jgi:acetyl esterase
MAAPSATVRAVHAPPRPSAADLASASAIAMVVDWFTPMTAPAGARLVEPITYASPGGRDLALFLHRRADASERQPAIVFVHGGGWAGCGPGMHLAHAHHFAARGYVTANVHYRLSGEAPWPACIDDVQAAIRWVRDHAAELGCDPDRIAVAGGSAGGHLAAMAALLGADDAAASVQAAVLWYPAVDLRAFTGDDPGPIDQLLPGADDAALLAASPMGVVTAAAPPVLTLTGSADDVTRLGDIEGLHERLAELGVRNELDVFEDGVHGFDYHPTDWQACVARIETFLGEVLGAG